MRRSLLVSGLTVASLAAACASNPAPVVATPVEATQPAPVAEPPAPSTTSASIEQAPAPRDDGRLPATATPRRYALTLNVDPGQERFQGQVTIDVDLPQPTPHVVLHGRGLNVLDVSVTTGSAALAGAATSRRSHGSVEPDELVLDFPQPVPAGRAALSITFDAPFDKELSGLYRVKEGERWYAFTQLESTFARRVFPCFDEPGFKVPFDLQITTPKGMIAVANTPELSRADAGATTSRFDFATTPPLPTYLLAFAVGDFDVREGAKTPVPIRLITVKGKAALGDIALDATAGLVKKLGDYFAIPYPFPKLDVVAVPDFAAGAMENPGLVTFREDFLLLDPNHANVAAKRYAAVVIAHELAHIWFGDLVTMKWWNDAWLNEGFATWMETKVTDLWHPDYAVHLDDVFNRQRIMDTDALASAQAVRQTATSPGEIEEMFDGISYEKGSAVLGMIEHWIGPDAMQRGVHDYLQAHAWKNAEEADLMAALDHASGKDVAGMAATFIDRAGVPAVALTSTCTGGKLDLGFTQSAWHPLGVEAKETDGTPWRIPVCFRAGPAAKEQCAELATASTSVALDVGSCPPWTLTNAGGVGYYRASLPEAETRALAKAQAQLDVADRISFVSNLLADVRSGRLSPDVALGVLPAFDRETDSHVLMAITRTLAAFDHAFVNERSRPAFRAYVSARLARAKQRLGWEAKDGEAGDAALARAEVLEAMGDLARDPATLKEAEAVASRWLKDPGSVDGDVASVAVPLASINAGPARLVELALALNTAKTPLDRRTAVKAIGSFDDKTTLARAWELALTREVRQQDSFSILGVAARRAETARLLFPWLAAHWDAARARTASGYARDLIVPIWSACDKDELDAERAFYQPRVKDLEGVERPLAEAAEHATACIALRASGADAVTKFFFKAGAR
jgi:aminopeptidase N